MTHVLLVEDEPAIADTLIYALRTDCYEVSHFLTGGEAILSAADNPYDIAILDIGLPDISGLDVCRRLRDAHRMPVLFLTARDSEIDRILGLEIGGDDYVTKPFSPREIVARVRAILRRSAPANPQPAAATIPLDPLPPATVNDLQHDKAAMRFLIHGNVLDLTAHEYRLLSVLIANPGRVFSRDQLLTHAWEDPGAVTDRAIDTHIKTIRAKLRAACPGTENLIETRRGLGYLSPRA